MIKKNELSEDNSSKKNEINQEKKILRSKSYRVKRRKCKRNNTF